MIPKFYDETFLTSLGIEVHRGSMDEKAEKNEIIRAATRSGALDEAQSSVYTSCLLVLFVGRFKIIGIQFNNLFSLNFPSASYLDERTADV